MLREINKLERVREKRPDTGKKTTVIQVNDLAVLKKKEKDYRQE